MCTKGCYLNSKFTSRKLALNISDILALARLSGHRTSLPASQKPAQSWTQSQKSHQSHQALWAAIAAGTGFRHRVIVDGLAQVCGGGEHGCVVGRENLKQLVSGRQCWSLCAFCVFSINTHDRRCNVES